MSLHKINWQKQQKKYLAFYTNSGFCLIALFLGIIFAIIVSVFWQYYSAGQKSNDSITYAKATELLRQSKPIEASEAFAALAKACNGGYNVLARFSEAAALLKANELSRAASTYMLIASDSSIPAPYGDLARLYSVQIRINTANGITLHREIAPLLNHHNAWKMLALETEAAIFAKEGNINSARKTLETITKDPSTPSKLRQRANELFKALVP
ncbi:hypothetical protein P856_242 [Candidatus Endolissoclinum faulkneri L5]|uniref:Ancillary SecYEG translocon subunit/Cell division coordinator CpoB TPR domain-containing protein n=1 Tax=Candidatus Endolissoclinum faulkneri L5 TaxID=1401328 RepID=V9TTH8_9PROT|nr:tetratricopeptide repeat protein [Candidatus Endolissoclinum faulkneri]AHC73472.1 hypothetical protein P856_242 [Candidatus Endolissoclinum faulkneri L5]